MVNCSELSTPPVMPGPGTIRPAASPELSAGTRTNGGRLLKAGRSAISSGSLVLEVCRIAAAGYDRCGFVAAAELQRADLAVATADG
jgi:hypothetical protein